MCDDVTFAFKVRVVERYIVGLNDIMNPYQEDVDLTTCILEFPTKQAFESYKSIFEECNPNIYLILLKEFVSVRDI